MRFAFRWLVRWTVFAFALLGIGRLLRLLLPEDASQTSADFAVASVMQGVDYVNRSDGLRSGTINVVMGGMRVDLRAATATPDGVDLDVFVKAGGVEVLVPAHWSVEVDATELMGGRVSTSTVGKEPRVDAPVLRVRATAILGGLQVDAA